MSLSVSYGYAQDLPDVALGLQPYVAYHGGELDSVSTLNGSLTVRIPLVSYPQKGSSLSLSYSVIFNSFGYQEVDNCIAVPDPNGSDDTIPLHNGCIANIQYLPAGMLNTPTGPRVVVDQSLSVAGNREAESAQVTNPPVQGRYFIVTPDLAQHPMGRANDGTFRSVDESGYLLESPFPTNYPANLGTPDPNRPSDSSSFVTAAAEGNITDFHGNAYTSNSITDPDGNAVNFSAGMSSDALSFTVTDSANRTIQAATPTDLSQCPTLPQAASQPLVSASLWTIPGNGAAGTVSYIFCYARVTISTHFPADVASGNFHQLNKTPTMLQSIVLPNNQFWGFIYYDSTNLGANPTGASGQLMKLIYPTRGSVAYTYGQFGGFCPTNRISGLNPQGIGVQLYANEVTSRTMTDSNGTALGTWNYAYGGFAPGISTTTGSITSPPSVLSPLGDITITKFQLDPNSTAETDLSCQYFDAGKKVYQGNSATGTPLQETSITYQFPAPPGLPSVSVPREHVTTTTLNGVSSTVTKQYDPGISFAEETCAFDGSSCTVGGSGTVPIGGPTLTTYGDFTGAILKKEATSYRWREGAPMLYLTANLLDIPSASQIQDGSGTVVASTTYSYDGPSSAGGGIRGHVTATTNVLNTGSSPTTYTGWNSSGQKIFTTDADGHTTNNNGHTTDYAYNLCNGSVVSNTLNALNQTTSGGYDCNTGALTSYTDANSNTSGFTYDAMRRVLTASYPDGGSTTFNYDDAHNTVTRTIAATPNPALTTSVVFDGFGRELHRTMSDAPQADVIDTTYDLNGRVSTVSNPYRSTADPTYGLTTYVYDALGRKKVETEPDGSTLQWSYLGPTVTSTDEDGNSWARTSDGLGRLTTVVEPTALTTTYSYNPQGDLTAVNQVGNPSIDAPRQRSFIYDSLSRLITANNPETGTICYGQLSGTSCINGYDANGNLLAKTDARGVTTHYAYDPLNRLTSKTYSDSTPEADYFYDGPGLNRIGHLSTGFVGGTNIYSVYDYGYDQMGRPVVKSFQLPNAAGNGLTPGAGSSGDTFDPAGHAIFFDAGTGATTSYVRDAAGHVTTLNSNLGEPAFTNATYTPLGGLASRLQTNNLTETRSYDKRGRQTSTVQANSGSSVGYSVTTGYDPVGNVTSINDSVNGNWTYVYDPLNRLHQAFASAGLDLDWEYDSFGNRKSQTPSGTGSAPQVSFSFTGNNNRADAPSGIVYDDAGNVLVDNLGQHYTYDAEERISSMSSILAGTVTYKYDSEGNLVYENGSSGTQVFLRNTAGQPIWTSSPTGVSGPFQNTNLYSDGELIGTLRDQVFYWAGKDTVGTKRFASGAVNNGPVPFVAETFTSLPFGDALSSIGNSPLHFTGKERDTESGLDYFGARYYGSNMGRYMSPDWDSDPDAVPFADLEYPQSLNLYGYVQNNPMSNTDPDGHVKCPDGTDADACVTTSLPPSVDLINVTGPARLAMQAYQHVSTFVDQLTNIMNTPGGPGCLGGAMLAGGIGGAAAGGGIGLAGVAGGGVAVVVTSPGGALIGSGLGAAGAGMAAMSACGGGGGGGGGGGSGGGGGGSNTAQAKKLTPGEITKLKNQGVDPEMLKIETMGGKNSSQFDLYKTSNGDIIVKGKGGVGPGEPTGLNINHFH